MKTGGIKKEEGENSLIDVKKEEESDESPGRAEFLVRKKKTEDSKSSKKKMTRNKVKKKSKSKSKQVLDGVPEFKITIRKSYLKFLVRFKP